MLIFTELPQLKKKYIDHYYILNAKLMTNTNRTELIVTEYLEVPLLKEILDDQAIERLLKILLDYWETGEIELLLCFPNVFHVALSKLSLPHIHHNLSYQEYFTKKLVLEFGQPILMSIMSAYPECFHGINDDPIKACQIFTEVTSISLEPCVLHSTFSITSKRASKVKRLFCKLLADKNEIEKGAAFMGPTNLMLSN